MSTCLNVKDSALNWFRPYLHLRSQVVAIEANISDSRNLDYGVPQGSFLGPLLFILGGDRSFACAAPSQWNKLPPSVRNAKSITCFKSKLKTHLFECAYIV